MGLQMFEELVLFVSGLRVQVASNSIHFLVEDLHQSDKPVEASSDVIGKPHWRLILKRMAHICPEILRTRLYLDLCDQASKVLVILWNQLRGKPNLVVDPVVTEAIILQIVRLVCLGQYFEHL